MVLTKIDPYTKVEQLDSQLVAQLSRLAVVTEVQKQADVNLDAPALSVFQRDGSTGGAVSSIILRGSFYKHTNHAKLSLALQFYTSTTDGTPFFKLYANGGALSATTTKGATGWSYNLLSLDISSLTSARVYDFEVEIGFQGAVSFPTENVKAKQVCVFAGEPS